MISAPHSLEWHYDPVMALSYSFPEDKPLVIRPEHQAAPAVVPPLAMPPVPALKTARGLAMSKAA
jgi:hypothetical protein